jgi:phosphoribosylaminoimidazole-succinocarboxamide synthase
VVFPTPITGKGRILNQLSNFWFKTLSGIIPNHLTDIAPEDVVQTREHDQVRDRSVVALRLDGLPLEAVARGYLEGSGWKEYQETGTVCGIALPPGLVRASPLPAPIFTPATKAAVGDHDINIPFEEAARLVGDSRAAEVRDVTLEIYNAASAYARQRGIVIADTKFEFGINKAGDLIWMDEALTPDSSRFWPLESYQPGQSPESFDKQFLRNWLETTGLNKRPPAPELPLDIVRGTAKRYQDALDRLTQ